MSVYSESSQVIRLKKGKGFESIPVNRIELATLRLFPGPQDVGRKTIVIQLNGKALQKFLAEIKFESPEEPGGVPAAMVTGEIELSINSEVIKKIVERKFTIFNDRLLNDAEANGVYYHTKKQILYSEYTKNCGPIPPGGSFDENCKIILVKPPKPH